MTKEALAKVVNTLPDEFEIDELLDKLIFMAKVEKGIEQIKEGKVTPYEEVKKISKTWSK